MRFDFWTEQQKIWIESVDVGWVNIASALKSKDLSLIPAVGIKLKEKVADWVFMKCEGGVLVEIHGLYSVSGVSPY